MGSRSCVPNPAFSKAIPHGMVEIDLSFRGPDFGGLPGYLGGIPRESPRGGFEALWGYPGGSAEAFWSSNAVYVASFEGGSRIPHLQRNLGRVVWGNSELRRSVIIGECPKNQDEDLTKD